ncbi:hypothetical protein [Yimella sp. cx-51]|uniref:hypothetical protein n=1 Tax=Yimella sp. cx-51 TaxID=2770551 RepID=UPI00351C6822
MAILNPYLSFKDNARDAMNFDQEVLGGDLQLMTFGDMGDESESKNLVMHAQLTTPSGFTLTASDTRPAWATPRLAASRSDSRAPRPMNCAATGRSWPTVAPW